jgi:hypothetical protein
VTARAASGRLTLAALVLAGLVVAAVGLGSSLMPPGRVIAALVGEGARMDSVIVWTLRLPRVALAVLVGMALAVAGAILQRVTRNPVAAPSILGITDGAAVGVVAFCGPNGSGKSTALRLMRGLLRPAAGSVEIAGRPLSDWSARDLARTVAMLSQSPEAPPELTVGELVMLGRFAHRGRLARPTAADRTACDRALTATETDALRDRPIGSFRAGSAARLDRDDTCAGCALHLSGRADEPP